MAETIRLIFHLRQLFPKHFKNTHGWQIANTLVSDFRFLRKKRKYPKRNLDKINVANFLKKEVYDENILELINYYIEQKSQMNKEFKFKLSTSIYK